MVKGLELGEWVTEGRGGCQPASVNHCYCVWELNVITFFVSFVYLHPLVAQFMASWQKRSTNVGTCSNLQIVVIRLSGAQHPLSSAQLSPVQSPGSRRARHGEVIGICSRSISTWGANIRNATSKIALDIDVSEILRLKEQRQLSKTQRILKVINFYTWKHLHCPFVC